MKKNSFSCLQPVVSVAGVAEKRLKGTMKPALRQPQHARFYMFMWWIIESIRGRSPDSSVSRVKREYQSACKRSHASSIQKSNIHAGLHNMLSSTGPKYFDLRFHLSISLNIPDVPGDVSIPPVINSSVTLKRSIHTWGLILIKSRPNLHILCSHYPN